MNKSSKITIAAILVGVFSISILTTPAFAEWDKTNYPKIQGTIPADNSEQKDTIALSVAMAVGENSVSDGKAVYGKLTDVNEFLVYKVVVITDNHAYYKILVDAGNGEALYVSDMIKRVTTKKPQTKNTVINQKNISRECLMNR